MIYAALAAVAAVAVAALGLHLRGWHRNAPLRREMRTYPIAFRTELGVVRFPNSAGWGGGDEVVGRGLLELIIRGNLVRVGLAFGLVIGPQFYFRAPETTIELSRNPLRIYGISSRREWIIVTGRQDGRDFQLAMTKRYFLDDVWTALAAAGAVPTSDGPSPRTGRNGLSG
jgi:hypothetical protein